MNAAKKSSPAVGGLHFLVGSWGRVVGVVVVLALFAAGFAAAWKQWGPAVAQQPQFRISAETIAITPAPEWLPADLKSQVVRDGSLHELSALDPLATVKVAQAFKMHPWVASVRRVTKQPPGRLEVDLEYRRPVAMVEVQTHDQRGLLPIDADAVLLPPEDFSPNAARNYPRISAGDTIPMGPVGAPWGDQRVAGAARIANAFGEHWAALDLYRIVATVDALPGGDRDRTLYLLATRQGAVIVWGSAPGGELRGEASKTQKVARLVEYVALHGPLDQLPSGHDLDLRDVTGPVVAPRTARLVPVELRP